MLSSKEPLDINAIRQNVEQANLGEKGLIVLLVIPDELTKTSFYQKVVKTLANKVVKSRQIRYFNRGIGFSAMSHGKAVVPLCVELELTR